MNKLLTTQEAFEELINEPMWWLGVLNTAGQATTVKRDYKRKKISEKKMAEILLKTGYTVAQEKLWLRKKQAMGKKKFTTVAAVAREIGLNHLALKLLDYLNQYHPDLALDYDFIMERADYAATVRDDMIKQSNGHPALLQEAESECNRVLMADLEFSEHSIIFDIVDSYYAQHSYARQPAEVKRIAIELRPQLKSIFAKYPTNDPEFTAEVEYDEMVEELTNEAKILLDKREELPF
ncbi:MAG: DUF1896 domain-containing protein [Prevotellaceae bacterium]|jgi:hypothetical protein|nr:DUF1896 domain-containing protein [Prevotellaceae bacterium]